MKPQICADGHGQIEHNPCLFVSVCGFIFFNINLSEYSAPKNEQQTDFFNGKQTACGSLSARLWNGGKLSFEVALSRKRFASGVNVFDFYNAGGKGYETENETSQPRDGMAMRLHLEQPLNFFQSRLRADFSRLTANFFNPFDLTVAPGSQRLQINPEKRPTSRRTLSFGFTDERPNNAGSVSFTVKIRQLSREIAERKTNYK